MTVQVDVTLRSRKATTNPLPVQGTVPYADCPLAVTKGATYDVASETWSLNETWLIVHRATGFNLGPEGWDTRKEALAILDRCDPTFAAWGMCTGVVGDPATAACKYKFRMATQRSE